MIKILIFVSTILLASSTAYAACPNAKGLSGMITNVCWSCILPIEVFGSVTFGSGVKEKPVGANEDMLCKCSSDPLDFNYGFSIGGWMPSHFVEVTNEPYCFASIEGTTLNGFNSRSKGFISVDRKPNGDMSSQFMHTHLVSFPLMVLLDFLVELNCNAGGIMDVDMMFMSEIDPFWTDGEMAIFRTPDAVLYANPIAQGSCALDAAAANTGKPLDEMHWCAGSWGSVYPIEGTIAQRNTSLVETQGLYATKLLTILHRIGIMDKTYGKSAMCGGEKDLFMDKSQYRLTQYFPVPEKSDFHRIGEVSFTWGEHRNKPNVSTYTNLIYRFTDCCLASD